MEVKVRNAVHEHAAAENLLQLQFTHYWGLCMPDA